jgi:DNA mismatch repair ATPase MutL
VDAWIAYLYRVLPNKPLHLALECQFVLELIYWPPFGKHAQLLAFDQHAVHERIRLEMFERAVLARRAVQFTGENAVAYTTEATSRRVSLDELELLRLREFQTYLRSWGFDWKESAGDDVGGSLMHREVRLLALLVNVCMYVCMYVWMYGCMDVWMSEDNRVARRVDVVYVADVFRCPLNLLPCEQATTDHGSAGVVLTRSPVVFGKVFGPKQFIECVEHAYIVKGNAQTIPRPFQRVLARRACRGAVMFGDRLSDAQAVKLLSDLPGCNFPFQCAHGRPSLAPLLAVQSLVQQRKQRSTASRQYAAMLRDK